MTRLYLARMEITDFRAYGHEPGLSLTLPPGPGMTILAGMNGLGKTAFFDAAEWALSGRVARMLAEPGDYEHLISWGDGWRADRCRVRMTFQDGSSVTRQAEREQGEDVKVLDTDGQPLPGVADLLRAPDWKPDIRDLGGYLGLTHFLSQSEKPRFLHKEGAEKWDLLCDPMGLRPLERVRKRLQVPTTNAFRNVREAKANELDTARQTLARWHERLVRLGELKDLAAAGAGLPPDALAAEIEEIYRELDAGFIASSQSIAPEQAMANLAASINAELERCAEQVQRAVICAGTAENWRKGAEGLAAAQASQITLQRQFEAEQAVFAPLALTVETAAALADDRRRARQVAAAELEGIRHALAAIEGVSEAAQALVAAVAALDACNQEITAQTAVRDDAEAVLARHAFLQHERTHAAQEQAAWRSLATRWDEYVDAQTLFQAQESERATIESRFVDLRAGAVTSAEEEQRLQDELSRLEARQAAAQGTLDEIGRAVARLAALLDDADMVCPLCDTRFDEPGTLRQRAAQRVGRGHGNLEPLLREVDEARENLRAQREARASAARTRAALEQALADLGRQGAIVSALRSSLEAEPRLAQCRSSDIPDFLSRNLAEAVAAEASATTGQAALEPYTSAEVRRDLANSALATANARRVAALSSRRGALERQQSWTLRMTDEQGVLATYGQDPDALRLAQMELQRKLSGAEGDLAQAERERADRSEQASAAQVAVSAARSRLETATAAVARRTVSQGQEEQRWTAQGFIGRPSEQAAADLRQKAEEKTALCRRLLSRHETALSRLSAWRSEEALRRMDREIRAESGGVTLEEHTAALELRERQATLELDRVVQAAKLAADLSTVLRDKQQQFTEAVLDPFSERVTAFERLISPFQHGIHFRGKQHRHRTAFNVGVSPFRPISGTSEEHGVEDFLSEGQISAMGVSVILGASTAYPWSRWPALLLDDPLQHTDLIHATAFVDVLRTLIQERGYQIVLSTHDLEEGEFIARKCRRFRIPTQRCVLVGSGVYGVRWKASVEF